MDRLNDQKRRRTTKRTKMTKRTEITEITKRTKKKQKEEKAQETKNKEKNKEKNQGEAQGEDWLLRKSAQPLGCTRHATRGILFCDYAQWMDGQKHVVNVVVIHK
jgi:outer membrane biosynthesis protein TonB